MSQFEAYVSNSNLVTVSKLKDLATDAFVNDAVGSVVVLDSKSVLVDLVVTDQSWPLDMVYSPGSDGTYTATLPPELALVVGSDYTARVTLTRAGVVFEVDVPSRAERRTAGKC